MKPNFLKQKIFDSIKKAIALAVLAVTLASCQKESATQVIKIEGMWAEYDGTELTKSFYEFKDGKYEYYTSKLDYLVRYSDLWGADKTDFTRYDFGSYSIQNGKLMLNERSAGELSLDSTILSIGSKRYQKFNELKKGVAGACKIILETNAVTIPADLYDTKVYYRVINLLPEQEHVTAEYTDSPDWTLYPFVTDEFVILGGKFNTSSPRQAEMVVSYPYAEDERITLIQMSYEDTK